MIASNTKDAKENRLESREFFVRAVTALVEQNIS